MLNSCLSIVFAKLIIYSIKLRSVVMLGGAYSRGRGWLDLLQWVVSLQQHCMIFLLKAEVVV